MRRATLVMFMVVSALGLMASGASAASPHFKHGGEPTCTISQSGSSATVTCTGSLAGLGNEDLRINVTVAGFAVYQCQNNGGNTAPGQNRVLAGPATSDTAIPASAIKNGNLTFTTNPATLTAAATVKARSTATRPCPIVSPATVSRSTARD